jgi:4-carboxymuconolactone decarboxylase
MLTLALLAATGNFEEIPMHVRATANTGATPRT